MPVVTPGSPVFAVPTCSVNALINPGNQIVNDITLSGGSYSATVVHLNYSSTGALAGWNFPEIQIDCFRWLANRHHGGYHQCAVGQQPAGR